MMIGEHMQERWFVLQTKPQKESMVEGLLTQARYKILCPRVRQYRHRVHPLFPRYCFLRANLHDANQYQLVRYTRGVVRVLGDERGPTAVPEQVMETLLAATQDGSVIRQELLYRPGELVRVTAGVLQDLIGIVEKNLSEEGRVRILFKWLSSKVRATVDCRYLASAA